MTSRDATVSRRATIALFAALAVWIALDRSLLAFSSGRHDAGLFLAAGRAWAAGAVPYRDFWDNKPPGIFAIDAVWAAAGGRGFVGLAVFETLLALAAAAAVGRLAAVAFGRRWFLPAAGVYGFGANLVVYTEGGNFPEFYATCCEIVAAGAIARAMTRRTTTHTATTARRSGLRPDVGSKSRPTNLLSSAAAAWFAAGAATAVATVFKPVGLAPALAASGLLAIAAPRDPRASANRFVLLWSGFAAGCAPVVAWAASHGTVAELWHAAVGYQFSYRESSDLDALAQLRRAAFLLYRLAPVWVGVAVWAAVVCAGAAWDMMELSLAYGPTKRPRVGAFRGLNTRGRAGYRTFLLLWAGATLAGASAGGFGYGHYYLPCAAPLTLVGIAGFAMATRAFGPRYPRKWFVASLILFAPFLARNVQHVVAAHRRLADERAEDARLAAAIDARLPPGAPVLAWGHYHALAALHERPHALPTLSVAHMEKSPEGAKRIRHELERAFAERPPGAIVLADPRGNRFPSPDAPAGARPRHPDGEAALLDLARTLEATYAPARVPPGATRAEDAIGLRFLRSDR